MINACVQTMPLMSNWEFEAAARAAKRSDDSPAKSEFEMLAHYQHSGQSSVTSKSHSSLTDNNNQHLPADAFDAWTKEHSKGSNKGEKLMDASCDQQCELVHSKSTPSQRIAQTTQITSPLQSLSYSAVAKPNFASISQCGAADVINTQQPQAQREEHVAVNSQPSAPPAERIKRPMNAFMAWAKEERKRMATEHPNEENATISRLLGLRWRDMDEAAKKPYRDRARELSKIHMRMHPDYKYKPRKKKTQNVAVMKSKNMNATPMKDSEPINSIPLNSYYSMNNGYEQIKASHHPAEARFHQHNAFANLDESDNLYTNQRPLSYTDFDLLYPARSWPAGGNPALEAQCDAPNGLTHASHFRRCLPPQIIDPNGDFELLSGAAAQPNNSLNGAMRYYYQPRRIHKSKLKQMYAYGTDEAKACQNLCTYSQY